VGSAFITFHGDYFQETKQPQPVRAGAACVRLAGGDQKSQ